MPLQDQGSRSSTAWMLLKYYLKPITVPFRLRFLSVDSMPRKAFLASVRLFSANFRVVSGRPLKESSATWPILLLERSTSARFFSGRNAATGIELSRLSFDRKMYYGFQLRLDLNANVWYQTGHGIQRVMVSNGSWYQTGQGIQRVMVSNGSWYPTGHGIKSCYLKVEVLQRVLLGLKGFGTDATDVAPWQLQVVDGHVLEDPVPQVDHAAVVHVQQVNHLLTNPSTTFSWLAFERLPSTLANGPYNSAGLRTLLRVLVLIMNLNCWTTPTEVSLQMSSMSALVMFSKTGSYFHVFRWIRSCNADWLLQSISASVLWDKVRYFLLAAKRISDQLHFFFFFFSKV